MSVFRFRLYVFERGAALLLYAGLLDARQAIESWWRPPGFLQPAVALLPVAGCAAVLLVVFRFARRLEDMQRRIHFEAVAFAFAAVVFGATAWPFPEDPGVPRLPAFALVPVMAACWGAGLPVATWRHR